MNFEKLTDLIGHSVLHPDVKALLQHFETEVPAVAQKGKSGYLDIPILRNQELGLELEFTTVVGAGEDLKSSFTGEKWELVLRSVQYWKIFEDKVFPFSISAGDSNKAITKKLNTKPYRRGKAMPDGAVVCYYKENFDIITRYTTDDKIESVWIHLQNSFAKDKIKLQAVAKVQQGNITSAHLDELNALSDDLPTKDWLVRIEEEKEEGEESPFTLENIGLAEEVLKEFLTDLQLATKNNKASQIEAAVKKTVKKFNKLNTKYDNFIETLERDDLVNFITKAVRLTGYTIVEGADITATWREEW